MVVVPEVIVCRHGRGLGSARGNAEHTAVAYQLRLSNFTMKLSVVIPAYNAETFLGQQLAALAGQQVNGTWEVLLADNGSTDMTKELAMSFADRLPISVVDASARRCRAAACNAGLRGAHGESILFVDADDVVQDGYLLAMQSALERHPFVASRLDCRVLNPGWIADVRAPAQATGVGQGAFRYGYGGSIGLRRDAVDRVGLFDETLRTAEDIDFCYRMAIAGFELQFVPEAVLAYRFRSTLAGIWRQAYHYGVGGAEIHRRYAAYGEPRSGVVDTSRLLLGTGIHAARGGRRGSWYRAAYLAANGLGQFRGRWLRSQAG